MSRSDAKQHLHYTRLFVVIIEYWRAIIFLAPDSSMSVMNDIDLYRLTFVAWSAVEPYIGSARGSFAEVSNWSKGK